MKCLRKQGSTQKETLDSDSGLIFAESRLSYRKDIFAE